MSTRFLVLFVWIGLLIPVNVVAQIPDGILGNPSQFAQADTTEQEAEEIIPWSVQLDPGFKSVTNDSLLRWEIWPNWGDYFAYRNDVISYRQGTIGRLDAFEIDGYSPLEQQITLNGISLNSPLTGYVNYNHIPANRVGEMSESKADSYYGKVRLRDYYLVEPLSYLNFDEASLDYRNLEFMVAQNFSERTNAEISFWDRRDGGYYPNNDVQGSQILFRGYHYLNQNLHVRAMILRNEFERDESFGYVVTDPNTFAFSQFSTISNRTGADSKNLRRDSKIGIYSRADSLGEEESGLEFYHTKNEFSLPFSVDTLDWDIRTQALKGFTNLGMGRFGIDGGFSLERHFSKSNRNYTKGDWNVASVTADIRADISEQLEFISSNSWTLRSDQHSGFTMNGGLQYSSSTTDFELNAGLFSRIPTIQQMYWQSVNYRGNSNLKNTTGISFSGSMKANFGDYFQSGISGRFQVLENDVFISTDSSFVNSDAYSVLSGSLFGEFENHRFIIKSSAAIHAATAEPPSNEFEANNQPDQKIWLRNNAYVKGYVFDRAAYVKLGVLTTFSPVSYRSRLFNTELQYWENAAWNEAEIPPFFRMDAELSARVRAIMVLIRWENALDGYGQAGYFEAATLPMPGRRLIVGIRAQFRN